MTPLTTNSLQRPRVRRITGMFVALLLFAMSVAGSALAATKTVLTVADWWSPSTPEMQAWWNYVKTEFEKRHPNVEIQYLWYTGTGDAREKLIVSYAGGTAPDVTQISVAFARELAAKGILLSLNKLMDREGQRIWQDQFPVAHMYASRDGNIYAIPQDINIAGLVYDADAFVRAGFNPDPFGLRNWNDLREAAKKLTVQSGDRITRYGLQGSINNGQGLAYWLSANGASIYNSDLSRITVNTPQAQQALEYWIEMQTGLGVVGGSFEQGTAAMVMNYGNFAGITLERARPDLNFRYTSMPPGPSGRDRTTVTWTNMTAILASTKHPDLAWEYVKFYTGLESRISMLKILNRVSAIRGLYTSDAWRQMVREHPYMATFGHMAEVGTPYPFVGTSTAIAAVVQEVNAVLAGNASPAAGLERAATRGSALLQETGW